MVVVDATFLLLFLDPVGTGVPLRKDGSPIKMVKERIELLLSDMKKSKQTVLIPTPVLSEVLMVAGASVQELVDKINSYSVFEIVPFDQIAAIELALMARQEDAKRRDPATTYAKLKYDRQIVAISKTKNVSVILSDDEQVKSLGRKLGLVVKGLEDLPLPPEQPQTDLFKEKS